MFDSVVRTLEIARAQRLILSRDHMADRVSPEQIKRLLAAGVLVRVHNNTYTVDGELDFRQRVAAAVLATGGAACGRTAARLYGLRGNSTVEEVHVVVSGTSIERLRGVWIHRTNLLEPIDVRRIDGVVATRPERTICDLAGVLPEWRAGSAFEGAILQGLTTHERTASYLSRFGRRGRRGTAAMRRILLDRDPSWRPTESGLEDKWCKVLRDRDIPLTEPQIELHCPGEGAIRVDRGIRDLQLAVEINSLLFHATREDQDRNQRKRRVLRRLGWVLLEYSQFDLEERPDWVAADYLQAVAERALRKSS